MNDVSGWETIAHHVTLNMGPWKGDPAQIGQWFPIEISGLAMDDKVMAVSVNLPNGPMSKNAQPHITIAVNREAGGKPAMSNKLQWGNVTPVFVVTEGQLVEAGSYTGLVLSAEGHETLVNIVNNLGFNLSPNLSQNPGFSQKTKTESLLRKYIRMVL
jgi:hypothetical protein